MYSCQQYKYRCNDIVNLVFYRDDIGRGVIRKHDVKKHVLRTRTGIIWFKEQYGHGLISFGSRNGADTDWTLLAQGTVPDSCKHANKGAGCSHYTGIPS
jgi:hypothetical protein